MGPIVIYREDKSRALTMTTMSLAAYGLVVCTVFAVILILGAPVWLVLPLAAGCLVGGIPAIARLSNRDREAPVKAACPTPERSFIVPLASPPPPRNFEGRAEELKKIRDLVGSWSGDRPAVVNITGLPGLGKTALAAQFAYLYQDLFPDGQLFASLDNMSDSDSLTEHTLSRFLVALQIVGEQAAESAADQSEQYAMLTSNLKLLVILDDASDPECVRNLLPSGAKCTVIVTSRNPLRGLHPDLPLPLSPLSESEAIRLLESAVGQDRVQAHSQAARQLVSAGHPRAIQLAASVLSNRPYWSLDQVLTQKASRTEPATPQDALAQELYLTIELLSNEERDALPYIALLDEPAFESWELAALLGISELNALRLCEHLSLTGVIKRVSVGRAGVVEFIVDDYIWQYLRRKMARKVPPDEQSARRRELEAERKARGRRRDTMHRLNETIQELRDAGRLAEALEASRDAVAAADDSGDGYAEALALATLADLHAAIGNINQAYELADAACRVRDIPAPPRALRCLGRVARRNGELDDSAKKLEEALTAAQRSGDTAEQIRILRETTLTLAHTGNPASGVAVADKAIGLCHDDPRLRASTLGGSLLAGASFARSYALLACGRAHDAGECLAEAVRRASEKQALWLAWMAWLRGRLAMELGEERAAIAACTEAIERFSAMSLRYGDGSSRLLLSRIYADADSDRLDEAIALASDAVDTFQNCGDRSAEYEAKRLLASYLRRRGQEFSDADDLEEARRISEVLGDDWDLAQIQGELAAVRSGPPASNWAGTLRRRR
jgi:tetratricopeptide (TPR) repeat protein